MRRISVLLAAFALTSTIPATRAQVPVEILWEACPYLLSTPASVALKRLQLPPDDIEAIADLTCDVAEALIDLAANPPSAPPEDLRTAEEIFCEGSFLDYCAGVHGATPMSAALRCRMKRLTIEDCAVATIRSEANRR